VFTYTNRERVHPALLDRMVEIDIEKYDFKQKMEIIYISSTNVIEKYKLPNELVQSLYRKDFVRVSGMDQKAKDCQRSRN
jgi:hypothetical protein